MQKKSNQNSEQGQAIVLLVLAFVAFLGFFALAIDGGMIYADRRHAQNATDASSLAGAGVAAQEMENLGVYFSNFTCGSANVTAVQNAAALAAVGRAASNDYTIDYDVSDFHGVQVICVDDEDKGTYLDKYLDVNTLITRTTNTALVHFVYSGPVQEQAETIARIRPRTPLAFGHAIVALNDAACSGNSNGVIVGGSSGTYVHGGGIFSNGCLKCNGSGPNFEVIVDSPNGIGYVEEMTNCSSGELDPEATNVPDKLPAASYDVDLPDCSGLPNRSIPSGQDVTLEPGVYSQINDNGKDTVTLNPGLYCVTGSPIAFKITTAWFYGDGVTIYATNGRVLISGGGDDEGNPSVLSAPAADPDPSPALSGMLILLAPGNTSDVQLTGNSETQFTGTVFAPDGDITATGSGALTAPFNTQLIGHNVQVEGNAFIDINFDGANSYGVPPRLDLQE